MFRFIFSNVYDVSFHIFRRSDFVGHPFGRKNYYFRRKIGKPFNLTDSVKFYSFGRKKNFFGRKHEIGTEDRNQRNAPSIGKLQRLQTPTNIENMVSKMTPAFSKLNLLSICIICFHFHYFYLIFFNFLKNSLHNIFSRHYDSVK